MNQLEQKLEQDFGIVFSQKDLLETAFTHTSYANEHRLLNISHNERLEFLGDAALQLVISVYLYNRYPNKPEGEMSKMRSTIVREESLASLYAHMMSAFFFSPWLALFAFLTVSILACSWLAY